VARAVLIKPTIHRAHEIRKIMRDTIKQAQAQLFTQRGYPLILGVEPRSRESREEFSLDLVSLLE
jgi:hypothetical protein